MSVCAYCRFMKTDTKLARKTAALGFAICGKGHRPKDFGAEFLDYYPVEMHQSCKSYECLPNDALRERKISIARWQDYLIRKMRGN